jgi:hypothetical protein
MANKKCSKCGEVKDVDNFYPDKRYLDGRRSNCKQCMGMYHKRRYGISEIKQRTLDWGKRYREKHPDRVWEAKILSRYGITADDYYELYKQQDGKCAICGVPKPARKLGVDHNHENGLLRGLLCSRCNNGIGIFQDNTEWLQKSIDYLEGWRQE